MKCGSTYFSQGKCDAIAHYEHSLRIYERNPLLNPNILFIHDNFAYVLLKRFQISRMGNDLHNAFEHFRLGVLTAADQDPMLVSQIKGLRCRNGDQLA